jgi:hypothetical protein
MNVQKHLSNLGLKVEDSVTGFKGVVTSISFDLYGCVKAVVHPGMNADGKLGESHWFDMNRLKILDIKPVLTQPDFELGPVAEGKKGAAEKPIFFKS